LNTLTNYLIRAYDAVLVNCISDAQTTGGGFEIAGPYVTLDGCVSKNTNYDNSSGLSLAGIMIVANGTGCIVNACQSHNNYYGLYTAANNTTVNASKFMSNNIGAAVYGTRGNFIGNAFKSNATYGLKCYGTTNTYVGNTFVSNSTADILRGTSGHQYYANVPYTLNYRTNDGTPVSALTPDYIGERVFDTNSSNWFVSNGVSDANWLCETYNP
jgi:hypothetical protein